MKDEKYFVTKEGDKYKVHLIDSNSILNDSVEYIMQTRKEQHNGQNIAWWYYLEDINGKPTRIEYNGWKSLAHFNTNSRYVPDQILIYITDPLGEKIRVTIEDAHHPDSIIKVIERVKFLSKFRNWQEYELSEQIRLLVDRINRLENEIEQLQNKK